MRKKVINADIKAMMAEYVISVTELAKQAHYSMIHVSKMLNNTGGKRLDADKRIIIMNALKELIYEEKR